MEFLNLDPMMGDFPGWSPYNYVACNPVRMIDPDGKAPIDGIGINSLGKEVYNDGKKDGKLYYFGDYQGFKLTSMAQVEKAGISYQTAIGANGQIESQEGFENFMKAAITGLKGSSADNYLNEIGSYKMDELYGKNMSTVVGIRSGNKGGPYTYTAYPEGEMTLNLGRNPDIRNDYNLFRSTLTHELRHIDQAKGIRNQGSLLFNNLSDYNKFDRGLEFDAYNYQINHGTFDLLNGSQRKNIISKRNFFSN